LTSLTATFEEKLYQPEEVCIASKDFKTGESQLINLDGDPLQELKVFVSTFVGGF